MINHAQDTSHPDVTFLCPVAHCGSAVARRTFNRRIFDRHMKRHKEKGDINGSKVYRPITEKCKVCRTQMYRNMLLASTSSDSSEDHLGEYCPIGED